MADEFGWGQAFQQKLLAIYVREPKKVFQVIEPGYFTSPIHVDLARIVKDSYQGKNQERVRITMPTLMALTKGALGKKRRESWPAYKQQIKELYEDRLRDIDVAITQALAFAKEQQFRQALIDAERDVNNRQYDRAITRFEKLKNFGAEYDLGVDYWKNPTDPKRWSETRKGLVRTFFFPKLDRAMEGGLAQGELGIVLAGGKVGKTTMLSRFAAGAMWQGKNVAIATGELSALKYQKRIDAMVTLTSTAALTRLGHQALEGKLSRKLEIVQNRMLMSHGPMRGNLYIKQYPTGKGKVSDIELWIDQLKRDGKKIDLLAVDYIRTFRPTERFEEQRLSIGQVCSDLRGLAGAQEIPVWTASQTTRGALSKENIGPSDIAEDISQFWTLDFLIALCQTKAEEEQKRARLMLTAARDTGHGDVIEVNLDRKTFRVWEKRERENKK